MKHWGIVGSSHSTYGQSIFRGTLCFSIAWFELDVWVLNNFPESR